ncbi:hypothetical protein ABZP36_015003 [Zizania latifolia]
MAKSAELACSMAKSAFDFLLFCLGNRARGLIFFFLLPWVFSSSACAAIRGGLDVQRCGRPCAAVQAAANNLVEKKDGGDGRLEFVSWTSSLLGHLFLVFSFPFLGMPFLPVASPVRGGLEVWFSHVACCFFVKPRFETTAYCKRP